LAEAGFTDIDIEPTRVYRSEDARQFLVESGIDMGANLSQIDGKFMAAFVRGTKPAARELLSAERAGVVATAEGACCAPGCCS
jgi:arsenite methyltransferase